MELFKIFKYDFPLSLKNLFTFCPKNLKLLLMIPKVRLDVTKQNFVFRASENWNEITKFVLEKCLPEKSGMIIPGSCINSDLSASVGL